MEIASLLYADDLILYGESEEGSESDSRTFCKRKGLKVNPDESKVMVLGGEEVSMCEIFENVT